MALELMTFVLPFVFVLALVYGALEVASIFRNRMVNAIIAIVIAFFAISNAGISEIIISIMPWAALLFIAIFFVKFVLNIFRPGTQGRDYTLVLAMLVLLGAFMVSHGTELIQDWLPAGSPISEENFMIIIGVIVILGIILAAYNKSK